MRAEAKILDRYVAKYTPTVVGLRLIDHKRLLHGFAVVTLGCGSWLVCWRGRMGQEYAKCRV